MKTILIIFSFLSLFSFSQTSLETKILNKVNDYRTSLGLNKLVFDTTCTSASQIQSTYLKSQKGLASHSNSKYENVDDRYKACGGKNPTKIGEVIAIQNSNYKATDSLYEEKMATAIVMSWKQSSGHNKIITDPQMKFFGVSSQIEKSNPDLKTWNHFDIFVVMVLVDNK